MQRSQAIREEVERILSEMTASELRSLAEEHGIDISGLRARADLADAIALFPGIARILEVDEAVGEEPPEADEEEIEVSEETEPADEPPEEEPPEEEEAPEPAEEPSSRQLKEQLRDALRARVDFSEPEEFLTETAERFKGRSYDAALVHAKDSVFRVEERVREYVRASWAFAIASAQRLWETADRSTRPARNAKGRLDEAVEAFQGDDFLRATDVLEALTSSALTLYEHEMERAREHVESQEQELRDIEAMGGDTAAAATLLQKAGEALEANNRSGYLDLIKEADSLVGRARKERIEEIRETADNVDAIIEEARDIGADVDGAADLLGEVRKALDGEDFVTAHDRVGQAERAALEAQKAHMDRVTQMRDEQVEKVRDLIGQIKPLVDEARSQGFDTSKAAENLKAAAEHVKAGDYVNALLKAKAAYRTVRSFRSQMEAKKLEKAPLPEEELPAPEGAEDEGSEASGVTCPECGASQVETGFRGKARCEKCGAKFRT